MAGTSYSKKDFIEGKIHPETWRIDYGSSDEISKTADYLYNYHAYREQVKEGEGKGDWRVFLGYNPTTEKKQFYKDFGTEQDAYDYQRQFNLNWASCLMECEEDKNMRARYGTTREGKKGSQTVFAERKVYADEKGEYCFGVVDSSQKEITERKIPFMKPAECRKAIVERQEERAKQEGGLDMSEPLWSKGLAEFATQEVRKELTPKTKSEAQKAAIAAYCAKCESMNSFLNSGVKGNWAFNVGGKEKGSPLMKNACLSKLKEVVENILSVREAMELTKRTMYVYRGEHGFNRDDNSTYQMKSLMSTATQGLIARTFADKKIDDLGAESATLYKMKLEPGTPCLHMGQITEFPLKFQECEALFAGGDFTDCVESKGNDKSKVVRCQGYVQRNMKEDLKVAMATAAERGVPIDEIKIIYSDACKRLDKQYAKEAIERDKILKNQKGTNKKIEDTQRGR